MGNLDDKDDPGGKAQVWLLNRSGGEARRLTEMRSGVSGSESSPDSSKLILVSKDSEKIQEKASNDTESDKPSYSTPKPIVIDRYQFKQDPVDYLDDEYQPDGRQIAYPQGGLCAQCSPSTKCRQARGALSLR